MDLLVEAKKEIDTYSKGGPISFSDLIQYAGELAFQFQKIISSLQIYHGYWYTQFVILWLLII